MWSAGTEQEEEADTRNSKQAGKEQKSLSLSLLDIYVGKSLRDFRFTAAVNPLL